MATVPHIKMDSRGPILITLLAMIMTACPISAVEKVDVNAFSSAPIKTYGYEIVNTYPHDPSAFTEGLIYENGVMYEGTGLYGKSSLRQANMTTGEILKITPLEDEFFGEGITIWEDKVIQLTWKSRQGLIWSKDNLCQTGNFSYQTEGWGLTANETRLIMSDGSDMLYFLDPEDYSLKGRLRISAAGKPVRGINELEYINGNIYANLWPSSWIAIISPENGEVTGRINLEGIMPENNSGRRIDVSNGIAYDESEDRLFVTGKLWPSLFEIDLIEINENIGNYSLF